MNTAKNTIAILILLSCSLLSRAQYYSFSYSQQTYTPITGGTSLTNGIIWDEPTFVIPLGFDFTALNLTGNEIHFDLGSGGIPYIDSANSDYTFFPAYGVDITDRSFNFTTLLEGDSGGVSDISYVVEGTAGSRVMKMQWTNSGFFSEIELDSISSASVDYQIWLYEGTNVVEYHYGPSVLPVPAECFDGFPGPLTGVLRGDVGDFKEIYELENSPLMPTMNYTTNSNNVSYLNDTIPQGMVYRFIPVPQSVNRLKAEQTIKFYPNPTNSKIQIVSIDAQKIESVEVWNTVGQKCMKLGSASEIDLSTQPAGVYMIRVLTADGAYTGSVTRE